MSTALTPPETDSTVYRTLLILDIDYFKQYNDHYGHIKGDECLRQVAQTLSQAANRPRDFIARIGGEEFVWLLPETDAESALDHEKSPVSPLLSISLGVGTTVPLQNGVALGFIEQVDRLLYQAKRNGRMRAEFAQFND
ncbi:MAG: sensor-containing diguanylate cyclase [Pseudomonas sp.]|nr:sensor-containing diguanylate cyclase [Pseudomonas sp.]